MTAGPTQDKTEQVGWEASKVGDVSSHASSQQPNLPTITSRALVALASNGMQQ